MIATVKSINNSYNPYDFGHRLVADISVTCETEDELQYLIGLLNKADIKKLMRQALVDSEPHKSKIDLKNDIEPIQDYSTIKSLEIS